MVSGEWADDKNLQFNEGYFKSAVSRTILFRATEKLVSQQAWYQGGYRANVVYYTMAKMALLASEAGRGLALDLDAIWRAQILPEGVSRQVQLVAKSMHDVITTPPAHVQNVTEWAKREQCWDRAKEVEVEVLPAFKDGLIEKAAMRDAAAQDKKQQKQDSGIGAQI